VSLEKTDSINWEINPAGRNVTSVFNLEDLMQCAVTSRLPLPFAEARKKKHAKK